MATGPAKPDCCGEAAATADEVTNIHWTPTVCNTSKDLQGFIISILKRKALRLRTVMTLARDCRARVNAGLPDSKVTLSTVTSLMVHREASCCLSGLCPQEAQLGVPLQVSPQLVFRPTPGVGVPVEGSLHTCG